MSDALLSRIAVALETIAAGQGVPLTATVMSGPGVAPAPAQPAQAATNTVTSEQLLSFVQPLVQVEGPQKEAVRAILVKYNLQRLGEAPESLYATLYNEFSAIPAGAPANEGLI